MGQIMVQALVDLVKTLSLIFNKRTRDESVGCLVVLALAVILYALWRPSSDTGFK